MLVIAIPPLIGGGVVELARAIERRDHYRAMVATCALREASERARALALERAATDCQARLGAVEPDPSRQQWLALAECCAEQSEACRLRAAYHARLRAAYRRGARFPIFPLAFDPPPPTTGLIAQFGPLDSSGARERDGFARKTSVSPFPASR
jgi:hypothetical protein